MRQLIMSPNYCFPKNNNPNTKGSENYFGKSVYFTHPCLN